jgi:hypothetical protein
MPTRTVASLLLFSALITTACGSHMSTPDIKQNPHPAKRYEITMTIEGAPGAFDSVDGYVMFQIQNDDCVPLQPGSGARLAPRKSVPLTLSKVNDSNSYKSTFYLDQLKDENYFGLGICHWNVGGAGLNLKVRNVTFSPSMSLQDIQSQKTISRYFIDEDYHDARKGAEHMLPVNIGESSPDGYKPELRTQLFSVTLTAKEH